MKKMMIFAVYDSKAKFYRNPFMMRSKGEAIRAFSGIANDKESEIGKYPEDFCLFHLATFDDESGRYENTVAPESMGLAIDYKTEERVKS